MFLILSIKHWKTIRIYLIVAQISVKIKKKKLKMSNRIIVLTFVKSSLYSLYI